MIELRPYQVEAADRGTQAIADGINWAGQAATGSGKTVILSEIIRRFDGRVCVLAHRDELIQQLKGTIEYHTSEAVGVEQAGVRSNGERIIACSVPTVGRKSGLARLPPADLVLIDEIHHSAAAGYRRVRDHYPNAIFGGVTATLRRTDGQSLRHMADEVIFDIPIHWLIDNDYLVPIDSKRVNSDTSLDGVPIRGEDFVPSYLGRVVNTPAVNALAIEYYLKHLSSRQFLAFVPTVQHAHDLVKMMLDRGLKVRVVDGGTPDNERKETNRLIKQGRLHGAVNVGVYTEGTDFPTISALLMLRPTKSPLLMTQMLGRGLRTCDFASWDRPLPELEPAKRDCAVLDMVYACRHSLVHPPSIAGTILADKSASVSKQKEVQDTELPQITIPIATFESFDPFLSTADQIEDYQWIHTSDGWAVHVPSGTVRVTDSLEVIGLGHHRQFTTSLEAFKFADDIIEDSGDYLLLEDEPCLTDEDRRREIELDLERIERECQAVLDYCFSY